MCLAFRWKKVITEIFKNISIQSEEIFLRQSGGKKVTTILFKKNSLHEKNSASVYSKTSSTWPITTLFSLNHPEGTTK